MKSPKWLESLMSSICTACISDVKGRMSGFSYRWSKPEANSWGTWLLMIAPSVIEIAGGKDDGSIGFDYVDVDLLALPQCLDEVEGSYNQPRSKAPFFYALFDSLYPERGFASLDFGDYLSLVLLDTNHTTPVAGEQADWLEKTLRERKDHPNVFAVNHVPSYPSYRNPDPVKGKDGKERAGTGADSRKHWVPLFEKYRVSVVLEHHDHTFKRTKALLGGLANDNGVLYLGDGSWGKLRTPKTPDKLSYLAVSGRDYHLSLHRIQGRERFHLAFDEHGRVMDVCRTGQRKNGLVRGS